MADKEELRGLLLETLGMHEFTRFLRQPKLSTHASGKLECAGFIFMRPASHTQLSNRALFRPRPVAVDAVSHQHR